MSLDTTTPKSRRAMLAGALGGLAGLVAGRLGHPEPAEAAAGSPLIIGSSSNNAGTANTQLLTNSNIVAFNLYQQGPGTALMGYTTPTTGQTRGVYGRVDSPNGDGVQARNAGAQGTGAAIRAYGGNNDGIVATTDNASKSAVRAQHSSSGTAIFGSSSSSTGVLGASSSGIGVFGSSNGYYGVYGSSTNDYGVVGVSSSHPAVVGSSTSSYGLYGTSSTSYGIYAYSSSSYAGHFGGDVYVSGTLSKSGGSFRIDHPLDPANQYLQHSFVESPDMKNVYDGLVTTDAKGEATVELPDWFDALNKDFRYQLTPIGEYAPVYVKSGVKDNQFSIAGGTPGLEVSWQVTGIRKDPWAKKHRIEVEVAKTGKDKGKYLHPELYGKPASKSLNPVPKAPEMPKAPASGK